MAIYKSKPAQINASADTVFNKLSNISNLKGLLAQHADGIPADKRELLDQVKVDGDTITFPAGPVGEVSLKLTRLIAPAQIRLEGVGTPVAMSLSLDITTLTPSSCEVMTIIDIAIPMMLKPMVGGALQKMADQATQAIAHIQYSE